MRKDILSVIADEKDITNVIVLTHNIDLVFVQNMVLPALRKCGHPTLTIFADAECAAETYEAQHMALDSIGRRYRVAPISMQPGFRFHPKAILLSGQEKGVLLVGSGNLTFGGWRENAETWCRFDTDADGTAPFASFRDYLYSVTSLAALKADPEVEVAEAFDGETRAWAVDMEPPGGLFGRAGNQTSLLEQMQAEIGEQRINEIFVCSPYFDPTGEALKDFHQTFGSSLKVAVQNRRTGMTADCAKALGDIISLDAVDFHHENHENQVRQAFIHSKWYGFKTAESVFVFAGSANCSQAALTIPGRRGNAELMTRAVLRPEDFEQYFTSELEFVDIPPELPRADPEEQTETTPGDYIRCTAARLDQSVIQIAYAGSAGVTISKAYINNQERPFSQLSDGTILINEISFADRHICLEGASNAGIMLSNKLWIDHENELRTSARKRSVIDAVRSKVQAHNWNIGAWNEIMNVFYKNLKYLPENTGKNRQDPTGGKKESSDDKKYTATDVFRSDFGSADFSSMIDRQVSTAKDRITSLRQLLVRWFGLAGEGDEGHVDTPEPESKNESEDEEAVDRPASLLSGGKSPAAERQADISEKERKRAQDTLDTVVKTMTSEDYACKRPPELLSIDLRFAAILLQVGLREEWINSQEFFSATHKIWSAFFFHASKTAPRGWLAYRCQTAEDPEAFKSNFASPMLAGALVSWALAAPPREKKPEHGLFYLAYLLSIARFPWIWAQDLGAVAEALKEILANSTKNLDSTLIEKVESGWTQMMREGYALYKFECAVGNATPKNLKNRISQRIVNSGEVLWQGEKTGFCIAMKKFSRTQRSNANNKYAKILSLVSDETKEVAPDYTIPARAILNDVLPVDNSQERRTLEKIFSKITSSVGKHAEAE